MHAYRAPRTPPARRKVWYRIVSIDRSIDQSVAVSHHAELALRAIATTTTGSITDYNFRMGYASCVVPQSPTPTPRPTANVPTGASLAIICSLCSICVDFGFTRCAWLDGTPTLVQVSMC
jgi:hypothetical protein